MIEEHTTVDGFKYIFDVKLANYLECFIADNCIVVVGGIAIEITTPYSIMKTKKLLSA